MEKAAFPVCPPSMRNLTEALFVFVVGKQIKPAGFLKLSFESRSAEPPL